MKNLPFLLVLAAAGVLGWIAFGAPEPSWTALELNAAEPSEVPSRLTPATPGAGLVVRTVQVEGMCCHGCRGKLYNAMLALPGVERAAVDFDAGTASIVAAPELVGERLAQALTFDKYTAREAH